MDMTVGEVQVQVRRTAPFTPTEHARGSAMADLVSDVLAHVRHDRPAPDGQPAFLTGAESVSAVVDGVLVGRAVLGPADDAGHRPLGIEVDRDWRGRGIGTRLLVEGGRLARQLGSDEVLLTTESGNPAVLPMLLAAGLRGRIRMAGDELTVRVPVRDLRPLSA
jgi:GNAT superfamily N-acetyltransferase